MKNIKLLFLVPSILLLAAGCGKSQVSNNPETPSYTGIENRKCTQLATSEIISILPNGANKYDLHINGYSPDNCYYGVTMLIGRDQQVDVQNVGTWIIETQSKKARHITMLGEPDYVFRDWISNTQLRLRSDNNDTIAIYDIPSKSIVSRKIENIVLRFNTKHDGPVNIKAFDVQADSVCSKTDFTNTGFLFYPLACIQQSDIQMIVEKYKTFLIHYEKVNEIKINGKVYNLPDVGNIQIEL